MQTREEVRGVTWFMRVSNTRAMHISRHRPCVVQMWYLSNKCWIGIVALHVVRCHGWGQNWLSVYMKHAYQWSVTKWCRQTGMYHWTSWEPVSGMLSMNAITEHAADGCHNWRTEAQQNGYLSDKPPLLQSWTYNFLSCIIIRGYTILNHRWRWNSWCWKIPLASTVVVHENCEHGADTMFWDSHRLILVNCMLHGVTGTAVALQLVLQCLMEAFHHQRPGLLTWYILLLHYTTNTLLDMWCWECVPHPQ
jgi:hypothetical protein